MGRVKTVARRAVLIGTLGGLALTGLPAHGQERREATGPLRVHPKNPRYFTDGSGRAVYLTGSHTWSNLQDQGPKDPPTALRLRPLSRLPARAEPQRHPPLGLGAGPLGALVRRQGPEPLRLVHQPEPVRPHRAGEGPRRQAEVRPGEVGRGVLRPAPHAGPAGGRAGDLRLGDALPGLELGQGLAGRHALARPPVPPRQQRAGLERQHEGRHRPRRSTTRGSASGRPPTSARSSTR